MSLFLIILWRGIVNTLFLLCLLIDVCSVEAFSGELVLGFVVMRLLPYIVPGLLKLFTFDVAVDLKFVCINLSKGLLAFNVLFIF